MSKKKKLVLVLEAFLIGKHFVGFSMESLMVPQHAYAVNKYNLREMGFFEGSQIASKNVITWNLFLINPYM